MASVDAFGVPFGVLPKTKEEFMAAIDSLLGSFVSELSAIADSPELLEAMTSDARDRFQKTVQAAERLNSRVFSVIHEYSFLFDEIAKSASSLKIADKEFEEILKQKQIAFKTRLRASLSKIRKFASDRLFELDEIPVPFGMEARKQKSRQLLEDLIGLNEMKIFKAFREGKYD